MSFKKFPDFFLNFSDSEMNGAAKHFYRFKSFRLDVEERQLLRHNDYIPLTPKVFDVLVALVRRSGHLVEKDELLRVVWADSFVEEVNVARAVHTLRKVLGEDDNGDKFIETVAKKGYRFVAEVTEGSEPSLSKSKNGKVNAPNARVTITETGDEISNLPPENFEVSTPATGETDSLPAGKPKPMTRFVLLAVGFVSAVLLVTLLALNRQSTASLDSGKVKSIAVLPLNSLTAENRDPLYDLGIADSLILTLSRVKNLTVRPLSATLRYTDGKKDAVAAGREQQVDYVLVSNYQIAGDKIRITSQLINVSTGGVEEVFKDEQAISNIFALQDEIAENFGRKILTKLNRESNDLTMKRYTKNDEAYRLYLMGAALVDKRSRKDAEKAIETLQDAVKLDPNYALAYARLANAYMAAGLYGGDSITQYPKQKAAIEKALAIDENLAEAYSYLGEMKLNSEWDFEGAERAMKKGVELDPNSAVAHQMYSLYLTSMGRSDEAVAEIKTAIYLDPASVLNQRNCGMTLYYARRYDEAITRLLQTIEIDPNFRTAYGWLIGSYRMKGEEAKAFEWFLRAPHRKDETPEKIELWKALYAKSGWRGIIKQQIEDANQDEKVGKPPRWETTRFYAELGDKEQAIIHLQRAFEQNQRGHSWTTLRVDPKLDTIRDDPRFEAIVKRVGLK